MICKLHSSLETYFHLQKIVEIDLKNIDYLQVIQNILYLPKNDFKKSRLPLTNKFLSNRIENSCTYPASILAPCFCPDTDWWALSVIAVATDMNLKQKKKLRKISHQLYLHVLLRAMKKFYLIHVHVS